MPQKSFTIHIPEVDSVRQGQEPFFVEYDGETKRLRTHDYDEIYKIPGLYEHLIHKKYKCDSPNVLCGLLEEQVDKSAMDISDLKVLDVGAGNGMVGEKLVEKGVDSVIGIDIYAEAAEAADRDRPNVYEDYYVEDLTQLTDSVQKEIEAKDLNCLTIVSSLGFDDIPPLAFVQAYNLISDTGWVAFNIKDEFVETADATGFAQLIHQMIDADILKLKTKQHYRHRFHQDGTPLYYFAFVGEKQHNISEDLMHEFI
ncbi:MAG: methyltransferase domain-containing protein [Planctomycetota bacterium]|jgi:SAM-dependent methyltransferase